MGGGLYYEKFCNLCFINIVYYSNNYKGSDLIMGFDDGNYNGVVYLGSVKWNDDNKHQMLFTENGVRSATARHNFLINHLTKINGNISAVTNPNGYIDIDCIVEDIEKVNYCYYRNDNNLSSTFYCCFVTNYDIIAKETTRLYLKWDYFQQFFYATTIFQSYIERTIIPKNEDTPLGNTLPEPISATLENEYKIKDILSSADWNPSWILHSASVYDTSDNEYHYEGVGTGNTFGEYCKKVNNVAEMQTILKNYGRKSVEEIAADANVQSGNTKFSDWVNAIFSGTALTEAIESVRATTSIADLQDHRTELIGLYAIPKWLADLANTTLLTNTRYTSTVNIPLNSAALANGYVPRNKKMLSSVCRAYVLANKTGLKIPLKPELFTENNTNIILSGIPTSTSGYNYELTNYLDYQQSYGDVGYSSERRVGYDSNTGINKALNLIGAGSQLVGAASSVYANPATALSGAESAISAGMKAIDNIGTKEAHIGNNGDLLNITDGRAQLSFYEINPLYNECVAIDNYFDMFGYSINKHGIINLYARSQWNYFKTSDFNCYVEGPTDAENAIKDMFNSGITLWFNYNNFGNYSVPNN